MDCVPDVAFVPDHAPLAEHELALPLDQESVDEPPEATLVGEAFKETVGAGELSLVTLTLRVIQPAFPQHTNVKVLVAPNGPTFSEPTVARRPDQAPDAEQRCTFFADQVSDDCPPTATLAGEALNESEGRDAATAVPPTNSNQQPIRHRQTARACIFLFYIQKSAQTR